MLAHPDVVYPIGVEDIATITLRWRPVFWDRPPLVLDALRQTQGSLIMSADSASLPRRRQASTNWKNVFRITAFRRHLPGTM